MARRVHVDRVEMGRVALAAAEAHHVRDVLRMAVGEAVELFDDAGRIGSAVLARVEAGAVEAEVRSIRAPRACPLRLTIAAAIPKGGRADWMIEKLSELGVERFVPLIAARSVVVPEGKNKLDRWRRIGQEASGQSRRAGVLEIDEPRRLKAVLEGAASAAAIGAVATTELPHAQARPLPALLAAAASPPDAVVEMCILIGPEGGWETGELQAMNAAHLTPITLGPTILRVETAAVAAAAIVASHRLALTQDPS